MSSSTDFDTAQMRPTELFAKKRLVHLLRFLLAGFVINLSLPVTSAQESVGKSSDSEVAMTEAAVQVAEDTVIRSLKYFPLVKERFPNQEFEVDLECTVSHFNANWRQFYVQDDDEATYFEVPEEILLPDGKIELGTRIRIRGRWSTSHYEIDVQSLEFLGHGEPAEPIIVNLATLKLHEHWSRRVQFEGKFEAITCIDDLVFARVSAGDRYFLVRYSTGRESLANQEWARELLGASVSMTGTLSYLIGPNDVPLIPIVHCMPKDKVQILRAGEVLENVREVEFGMENEVDAGETVEFRGDVAHIRQYDLLVLQRGRKNSRIYMTAPPDLVPGQVVRVIATRLGERQLDQQPIAEGFDARGADCDWQAHLLIVESQGSRVFDSLDKDRLSSELFDSGVGRVKGELISVYSEGTLRFIELQDDAFRYDATFRASDDQFEAMQLGKAAVLKLSGFVYRVAGDDSQHFQVDVSRLSDIEILSLRPTIDRQLFLYIMAACTAVLVGAGVLVWRLRGKVGRTSADLACAVARLNSSYDAVREGIMVIDDHGNVVAVNTRVTEILGLTSQFLLQHNNTKPTPLKALSARFTDSDAFSNAWRQAQRDPEFTSTIELQTIDEEPRTLVIFTAPVKTPNSSDVAVSENRIWTFDDISEQKQLQANLIQSQKMEAVGRLAGGVAHDFNNLLLAISANLELLKMNLDQDSEGVEFVDAAEAAVDRAAKLVKNLLRFSRKSKLEIRVGDLNALILRTRSLVERVMGNSIGLTVDLADGLPCVRMDEGHIEQVLFNLCLNASDACAEAGGSIHLSTAKVDRQEVHSRLKRDYDRELFEEYVVIVVEDNGTGMTEEVIQKAFDPFFTTKEFGKGTGLGLSMSLGIIEQHRGIIQFESQAGVGTRFEVYLPSTKQQVTESEESRPIQLADNCNAKLLLADDEELVRTSSAKALRELGFEVITAKDGVDALIQLRSQEFDLAILDLEMPGMSGLEVVSEVQRQWPNFPLIVTSGHSDRVDELCPVDAEHVSAISKPYRLESLVRTIKHVLGDSSMTSRA